MGGTAPTGGSNGDLVFSVGTLTEGYTVHLLSSDADA
jgi:hypothetical protein